MSKQVTPGQSTHAAEPPMMSKAERRAAGKLAAQKRAAAKRRKKAMRNASVALAGIAVVVVLVIIFGGFGADDATPAASGVPSETAAAPTAAPATAVPDNVDPALKTKPEVPAPSGDIAELKVTTIIKGEGPVVQAGQTISVNYIGLSFKDGKQFDSSWDAGRPLSFPIGQGGVIKGWDEALVGVTVGSRLQLDIPADKAYGDTPPQGYPAGDLRFVVDILSAT